LRPGVFTLGEIGYVTPDGFVYITDRFSDMIVSGGVNIYPAEAEKVLIEHPQVADVAVIGVPDKDMGEAVKALVVPQDMNNAPTPEELIALCREHLAGYKCPRTVEIVSTVGRNAMGKINKRTLRAPYWESGRTIG
jgi:acyl-CoA synthetase (AMP-forming)/AMP-acid ligase II